MPARLRAMLLLNGIGLFAFALLTGWFWFVALLGQIVVWPVIPAIPAHIPGGARARRRVHMEAISHGLLLMGWGLGGPFKGGHANNIIFLTGWPPLLAVHLTLALVAIGVWHSVKALPPA